MAAADAVISGLVRSYCSHIVSAVLSGRRHFALPVSEPPQVTTLEQAATAVSAFTPAARHFERFFVYDTDAVESGAYLVDLRPGEEAALAAFCTQLYRAHATPNANLPTGCAAYEVLAAPGAQGLEPKALGRRQFAEAERGGILALFPHLVLLDWEVSPGAAHLGKGDLVLTDGQGAYLVVQTAGLDEELTGAKARLKRTTKRAALRTACETYLARARERLQHCRPLAVMAGGFNTFDGFSNFVHPTQPGLEAVINGLRQLAGMPPVTLGRGGEGPAPASAWVPAALATPSSPPGVAHQPSSQPVAAHHTYVPQLLPPSHFLRASMAPYPHLQAPQPAAAGPAGFGGMQQIQQQQQQQAEQQPTRPTPLAGMEVLRQLLEGGAPSAAAPSSGAQLQQLAPALPLAPPRVQQQPTAVAIPPLQASSASQYQPTALLPSSLMQPLQPAPQQVSLSSLSLLLGPTATAPPPGAAPAGAAAASRGWWPETSGTSRSGPPRYLATDAPSERNAPPAWAAAASNTTVPRPTAVPSPWQFPVPTLPPSAAAAAAPAKVAELHPAPGIAAPLPMAMPIPAPANSADVASAAAASAGKASGMPAPQQQQLYAGSGSQAAAGAAQAAATGTAATGGAQPESGNGSTGSEPHAPLTAQPHLPAIARRPAKLSNGPLSALLQLQPCDLQDMPQLAALWQRVEEVAGATAAAEGGRSREGGVASWADALDRLEVCSQAVVAATKELDVKGGMIRDLVCAWRQELGGAGGGSNGGGGGSAAQQGASSAPPPPAVWVHDAEAAVEEVHKLAAGLAVTQQLLHQQAARCRQLATQLGANLYRGYRAAKAAGGASADSL